MPPRRKKPPKIPQSMEATVKSEKVDNNVDDIAKTLKEYTCNICSSSFKKKQDFGKHLKLCRTKKAILKISKKTAEYYKCKECKKVYKFKKSFLNHCQNEHSQEPDSVCCAHCIVRCPNKKILIRHINKVHVKPQFECRSCKKKFVRQFHVVRHMTQSGCDGAQKTSYPCEICNKEFSRKDNLMVHLRFQHILKVCYTCKHCTYGTRNFSRLVKHWQTYHMDPKKYECDICGKSTGSRASMAKHLEIHGEKKYVCDVCEYKTFTQEVMKRHILTHVIDKPHKCDICGQSYIQRLQLKRHLEKHTGNECAVCNQTFKTKASLLIHERTHKGIKKLACPFDDCAYSKKEFNNEKDLNAHVKIHLTKKDVKCEVCDKMFESEMYMRRHLSVHRLDRPRRCMYCMSPRAYIRGEQLLRHVRRQHPELFHQHLAHVRNVLGTNIKIDRVRKSELESILNLLDAESDRILDGYSGMDVLYGGVQLEVENVAQAKEDSVIVKTEPNPLMSEEELEENLRKLLSQLIDKDTLEIFGWPEESVDTVLEKVIEHCGARAADRSRWTRVQCLRENTKHLFLYAVEDKNVARMLDTHTIDQIVKHILAQVVD